MRDACGMDVCTNNWSGLQPRGGPIEDSWFVCRVALGLRCGQLRIAGYGRYGFLR